MKKPDAKTDVGILIVAQNASHTFGGEAFLPVKYFEKLRLRGYPVKLIAHERNREDLERGLARHIEHIYFIEDSIFHKAVWRVGSVFPKAIEDAIFSNVLNIINEIYQARIIRGLIGRGEVDVIHQPIPVSPLAPSALYGFGVPVVIGPMNGGMSYPPGYEDYESASTRAFVKVARKIALVFNAVIPGKRRAAALLVANERTRRALPVSGHANVIRLVENSVDLGTWRRSGGERRKPAEGPLTLVFMGRLIALKAVDITLQAVALAREAGVDVELRILGDGPERRRLEELSGALDLQEAVHFLGFRAQSQCVEVLEAADALILNSLRECGGAVVLEAMSLGLPVIASDWGGPADYLDASCGILVSPVPKSDFPRRLADAIVLLALDPQQRLKMGLCGVGRVKKHFDWDDKIDAILEIYKACMATGSVERSSLS